MPDSDTPASPSHGKSMISAFRAERLANRPTLRAERIAARKSLRVDRLGRLNPALVANAAPEPPARMEAPAAEAPGSGSVFAQYVEDERQALAPAQEAQPDPLPGSASAALAPASAQSVSVPELLSGTLPEPLEECRSTPTGPHLCYCPDLAALGFGPGMTARLHHLGIVSVTDLAGTDAANLRNALGDVGDLVNVDFWIDQARTLLRSAA